MKRQEALSVGIQSMEGIFAAWDEIALLVTARCGVVRASPLANRYVGSGDGWSIRGGQLRHKAGQIQAMLEAHCLATASDGKRRSLATRAGWGDITTVEIGAAPRSFSLYGGRLVLVRMRRRDAFSEPETAKLIGLFGLTRAEAEVLACLVAGHSVSEIATVRGASVFTVRKQVDSLMRKMECNRQAELVRLASLL